jgi:predicted SnoaL-like aldol condensation-catalyzing enzyme
MTVALLAAAFLTREYVGVGDGRTDELWRRPSSRCVTEVDAAGMEEQAMKATVVRYQAKPERAAENQELIEAVFAGLDERQPEGFTYKVFRLEDGVSFLHVVIEHDVDDPDSLQAVPAFQAFVAGIAERCDVPPVATGATIVGGYR